jgi:hypothetical protein
MSPARRPTPIRLYHAGVVIAASASWAVLLHAAAWAAISPARVSWWVFALICCLARARTIPLRFRREAYPISLGAVGLVLGLYALSPEGLLAATLAGTAAALVLARPRDAAGVVPGLARAALAAAVALVVFHAVAGTGNPFGPAGWAGATLGVVAASLVEAAFRAAAVAVGEGSRDAGRRRPPYAISHRCSRSSSCRTSSSSRSRSSGRKRTRSSSSSSPLRSRSRPSARRSHSRGGRSASSTPSSGTPGDARERAGSSARSRR